MVLNWTLSDEMIRSDFAIGVTYDSPVKKVRELIGQVVDQHKKVKKEPEPIILAFRFWK